MHGKKDLAQSLAREFGSTVPTAEKTVRLGNETTGRKFFAHYIPPNTYFSPAHATQIRDIEVNMAKSNRFGTTRAAGRFMNNTWVQVMNLLRRQKQLHEALLHSSPTFQVTFR